MSTNHAGAQGEAIRDRVVAWATAQLATDRLWLPNEKFTEPDPDEADPAGSAWARLSILGVDGQPLTLGPGAKHQDRRLVVVDVFVPAGTRASIAELLANSVAEQFRGQSDLSNALYYRNVLAQESDTQEDGGAWYRWQVQALAIYQFHAGAAILETSYPVITYEATAHGLSPGDAVYRSGAGWAKAIATAASTLADGVVVSAPNADIAHISLGPTAEVASHGLGTAAEDLYLSRSTVGLLVTLAARDAEGRQDWYQAVAVVDTADRLLLKHGLAQEI